MCTSLDTIILGTFMSIAMFMVIRSRISSYLSSPDHYFTVEPWPNFPLCGMQWSTPSDANFEQATPINVPAIPPPPPPLPPKRKVSLPKSEQVSAVMPRVPLLPPRGKTASSDTKLQDGARRKPALVCIAFYPN